MESGWGGHSGAISRSFACCRAWEQPQGTARAGQGEVAEGLSTRGTASIGCSLWRWDQPSRRTGNQHPLGTPQPHKTTRVFPSSCVQPQQHPNPSHPCPQPPCSPPLTWSAWHSRSQVLCASTQRLGFSWLGQTPRCRILAGCRLSPAAAAASKGRSSAARIGSALPSCCPPACTRGPGRPKLRRGIWLPCALPRGSAQITLDGREKKKSKKKNQKGGREDKEEEEMRSKPLWFSTPAACWLCGDAARHLRPSLSPQGDGDSIVQRWLSLAGVPVLLGGSLHAWHPEAVAAAAGPGSQHGGSGQWGWGAACVWGRGGRGGREGCNLNPLPSH